MTLAFWVLFLSRVTAWSPCCPHPGWDHCASENLRSSATVLWTPSSDCTCSGLSLLLHWPLLPARGIHPLSLGSSDTGFERSRRQGRKRLRPSFCYLWNELVKLINSVALQLFKKQSTKKPPQNTPANIPNRISACTIGDAEPLGVGEGPSAGSSQPPPVTAWPPLRVLKMKILGTV